MADSFRYHLTLWTVTVATFLLLDFAKRLDDLLYGLSAMSLAVNVGLVALCSWPLCLSLGMLGALVERLGGVRAAHSVAVFGFVTINVWSLKVGLAGWLQNFPHPTRVGIAVLLLVLAVLLSVGVGYRGKDRQKFWQQRSKTVLWAWAALGVVGLSASFWAAPVGKPTSSDKPSVILVTMDALSAKHTTVYGYERDTTPNLAKLAKESVVLERLHSNFNVTGLALPSLNGYLSTTPAGKTLTQSLQEGGYPHTAFFSFWAPDLFFLQDFSHFQLTRSAMLSPVYGRLGKHFSEPQLRWLAGLASEEWSYFNPYLAEYHDDIFWRTVHYPPEVSLRQALDYLEGHPKGAFVWVHLWPPHFPYLPDADTQALFGPGPGYMKPWVNVAYDEDQDGYVAGLKNLYDQSVYSTDRHLGRFLDQLRERGTLDSSYLIVSADHGESFERGYLGHSGWPLMEAITHVPMIIRQPAGQQQIRVQTLAQQLDFAPTILNLLGLPIPQAMQGESLVPYIENPERLSERYKISISLLASTGEGGQLAVYWKTFKLMFLSNDPSVYRLYDIFQDPGATKDISKQHPQVVEEMMKRLVLPPP
jgi:arylsulfatase A-like enzyme